MSELPDQYIGNYRLVRLLAQEGPVETYLASHKHLATAAIVKIISVQLTGEQEQLFQRKAQPIAELMHKHIVRLLDFEVLQGRPVLFLEHFPAGTLRKVHPQGTPTMFKQALSYVKRLASALQYMHTRQLVHGDLRPENVLLGWESNLLLNNGGLVEMVRVLAPESSYQPTEAFPYLAPERFQGQLLPASDQYALAVMLYEWLCGETPFQGAFAAQVTAHLNSEPPALSTRGARLPSEVEQVIMIALAKDPTRRFATVQAFATALEQAGKDVEGMSTSAVTLAPTLPIQVPPAVAPEPSITPEAGTLPANQGIAPTPQGRLSRRAMFAMFALGGIGLVAASSGGTLALLNLGNHAGSAQATQLKLVGKLLATCPNAGIIQYMSWSPDGQRLVSSGLADGGLDANSIQIWEAASAKLVSATPGMITGLTLPLGENLYAWVGERFYQATIDTSDQQNPVIRIRDLVGKKDVLVYQGYVSERSTSTDVVSPVKVSWSPNGQVIASLAYETGIRVWNAQTGHDISTFQAPVGDQGITDPSTLAVTYMVWAPDSRHMVAWGGPGILYVWDTSNGKRVCSYTRHWEQHQNDREFPSIVPYPVWSSDSTRIVSSVATDQLFHSKDGVIHVWDARNGQEICTFNHGQHDNTTHSTAWSADSQLIASVIQGSDVVWDASSGAIMTTRYTQGGDTVAWHPQRRYLASTMASTTDTGDDYKGYIWDAMTGKEILRVNSTTHDTLAWSPDGLRLALATLNNTVEIWQIWE